MKKELLPLLVLSLLTLFQTTTKAEEINLGQYLQASTEQPYNVSFWLQNATCQSNSGWSRNSQDAAAGYNKYNTEFNSSIYKSKTI